MVRETRAYEASDGSLHKNKHHAALQDLRIELKKIIPNNDALLNEVYNKRRSFFVALRDFYAAGEEECENALAS